VMDEEPQAAVVADVATAPDPDLDGIPNPVVLEEAVGRINELYAVVPLVTADGSIQLQVAKGGVFAYYEFSWPAEDRLTDEAWRGMLDDGTAPPAPEWTASFMTDQTEEAALLQGIYSFERGLSPAYWDLDTSWALGSAGDEVKAQVQAELEALRAEGHYIGHQFVHADYRSFDFQSETVAVVTVRETWQDALYAFTDAPGDAGTPSDPIGHRGPYTLDVTYTLERGEYGWNVTRVVYGNEPSAWTE
jgi:hypothetical protein